MPGFGLGIRIGSTNGPSGPPDIVPGIISQDLTAWTAVRLTVSAAVLPATLTESTDAGATTHDLYTEPAQDNGDWIYQVDFTPLNTRHIELRGNSSGAIMRVNHGALTIVGSGTQFVSGSAIALGGGVFRATLRYTRTASNRVYIRADANPTGAFYQGDGRQALTIHAVGLNAA